MGDLLHLPARPAPTANDTAVVRGCWACGQLLYDDEPGLCTDCTVALDTPPTPATGKQRPLSWYLRHLTPDTLRAMCDAITEAGIAHAEEGAAAWAGDHLDGPERSRFVGAVRGRAQLEYSTRCAADAQAFGERQGWNRGAR